jgi:hypothetical protein
MRNSKLPVESSILFIWPLKWLLRWTVLVVIHNQWNETPLLLPKQLNPFDSLYYNLDKQDGNLKATAQSVKRLFWKRRQAVTKLLLDPWSKVAFPCKANQKLADHRDLAYSSSTYWPCQLYLCNNICNSKSQCTSSVRGQWYKCWPFKRLKGYSPSYAIMLWEFRSGFIVIIILILVTQGFCHWPAASTNKTKKSWSFVGKISRTLDIWEKTILEK